MVANLTFLDHPRHLAGDFFRFYSQNIVAGLYDPTADAILQLQLLPSPPEIERAALRALIPTRLDHARQYDVKNFASSQLTIRSPAAHARLECQHFRCAISAVVLSADPGSLAYMSLDAIDASKPHSEDNIQWICPCLDGHTVTPFDHAATRPTSDLVVECLVAVHGEADVGLQHN